MIRSLRFLTIGIGLIGALASSGFGQTSGGLLAVPAQVQSTPAVAPVQPRPAEPAAPASSTTTAAAENSVRETLAAYIAAYNQKNAAKVVEFFTPDGTLIDSANVSTRGREAILQEFSEAFAERSTYTLEAKIERVRLIVPDVAQAAGEARLVSPKEATIANQFVVLLTRQGGAWRIVEIRDYPAPAGSVTPYERLKELEWMVGDWVDESEDAQVSSTVRWGQGKGYLVRDYSVQIKGEPATSGLMIIAWDPQTAQIKSSIFNADGSRGEGSWTRATDNQWVVKAHGSTGDGQPTSATQVISMVNKDAIKTSSIDRVIGDEIARDVEDIIMVRKPLAPGTTPSPAKPATAAAPAPPH
jgi:uncharacterized protein (TIGR02246 family)